MLFYTNNLAINENDNSLFQSINKFMMKHISEENDNSLIIHDSLSGRIYVVFVMEELIIQCNSKYNDTAIINVIYRELYSKVIKKHNLNLNEISIARCIKYFLSRNNIRMPISEYIYNMYHKVICHLTNDLTVYQ